MAKRGTKAGKMLEAMGEAARVASVMVNGEEANRIITDRAAHYAAHPDPQYRTMAGDYYDVEHQTFLRMKKTLQRLQRLVGFPCHTALWVRMRDLEGHMTLALQNGTVHRYYRFGGSRIETPPEMEACMSSREITTAPGDHPTETLTVLAPVEDSLGDVVGVVELSALEPGAKTRPKAWE
jgi:hypothetical protein